MIDGRSIDGRAIGAKWGINFGGSLAADPVGGGDSSASPIRDESPLFSFGTSAAPDTDVAWAGASLSVEYSTSIDLRAASSAGPLIVDCLQIMGFRESDVQTLIGFPCASGPNTAISASVLIIDCRLSSAEVRAYALCHTSVACVPHEIECQLSPAPQSRNLGSLRGRGCASGGELSLRQVVRCSPAIY
jgi:hypothetical protein